MIDEDCYIKGTYEDESFDPSGAFIFGKYDYEEMEDIDEAYDWDEYEQDDFYQEKWYEELNEMASNLEIEYIQYLKEREENPQDYE
jgi:hypothetical protein